MFFFSFFVFRKKYITHVFVCFFFRKMKCIEMVSRKQTWCDNLRIIEIFYLFIFVFLVFSFFFSGAEKPFVKKIDFYRLRIKFRISKCIRLNSNENACEANWLYMFTDIGVWFCLNKFNDKTEIIKLTNKQKIKFHAIPCYFPHPIIERKLKWDNTN